MNWRPPHDSNLKYDGWFMPKKWQPATPEAAPGNLFRDAPPATYRGGVWYDVHSGVVAHYDSKPV
eukprot:6325863-Lingulodinium_polyedra.AAC.1